VKTDSVTEATKPRGSLAGRVDQACDRFEAAWRAGQPLQIEDLLADFERPAQGLLLHELLLI
jgi:hypothetical protein